MPGRRVSKLVLENFKGFSDRIELDLDAEVVLLVGPNGRGKTSTIEALELIVAGAIGQRIGDKSEFDLRDFIHCKRLTGQRCSEAKVQVTWKDQSVDEVVIRSANGPITSGAWASQRENEWSGSSEAELTRACTFLYSDSLGSLAGLDLSARRKVIDFFVPNFPRLEDLSDREVPYLAGQLADFLRRFEADLPNRQQLGAKEAQRAVAAQDAWNNVASDNVRFAKKGPALLAEQSIKRELSRICSFLNLDASSSGEYLQQLRRISEAAAARAEAIDTERKVEARSSSLSQAAWISIQSILRKLEQKHLHTSSPGVLSPEGVSDRKRVLGSASSLHARREALDIARTEADGAIAALRQDLGKDGFPAGMPGIAIGILPMLATLAKLDVSKSLPGWWVEVGLPRPDPVLFARLLSDEVQRWVNLQAQLAELDSRIRNVDLEIAELSSLEALEPLLEELSRAWSETGQVGPLPIGSDNRLAVDEIRRLAADSLNRVEPANIQAGQLAVKWRLVADVFLAWADARAATLDGERLWTERQGYASAYEQLQRLKKLVDHVGSTGKGCFKDVLRARVAEQKYQKELNDSLQRVLRWYAHRSDVVERARIEFHRHGPLQVRVGPEDGQSTGIATLSRSQLTSLAFGLAIVANLGHPSLPTGFVCLDDVSDAFDLENLAADAAMLRLLAYGSGDAGEAGRRQLVLTNHNDQLTDRIVPLLLPPAGRRMIIIEFIDEGHDKPIRAKQWEVQGEQRKKWNCESPLRALLPEVAADALGARGAGTG
ncbi:AAA family ATPase [Archangium gephyra]|nr:AAA family ATPase [Archangium gephyra]